MFNRLTSLKNLFLGWLLINKIVEKTSLASAEANLTPPFEITFDEPNIERIEYILPLTLGGHIVGGITNNYGSIEENVMLAKLNQNMTFDWVAISDGIALMHINTWPDGSILIIGSDRKAPINTNKRFFSKINSHGSFDWGYKYPYGVSVSASAILSTGEIVFTGKYTTADNQGIFTTRTDSMGAMIWAVKWGGRDGGASDIFSLPGDYTITIGSTKNFNAVTPNYLAAELSPAGQILWAIRWTYTPYQSSSELLQMTPYLQQSFIAIGRTYSSSSFSKAGVFRISNAGSLNWSVYFIKDSWAIPQRVIVANNGEIVVKGTFGKNNDIAFILRLMANGTFISAAISNTTNYLSIMDISLINNHTMIAVGGKIRNGITNSLISSKEYDNAIGCGYLIPINATDIEYEFRNNAADAIVITESVKAEAVSIAIMGRSSFNKYFNRVSPNINYYQCETNTSSPSPSSDMISNSTPFSTSSQSSPSTANISTSESNFSASSLFSSKSASDQKAPSESKELTDTTATDAGIGIAVTLATCLAAVGIFETRRRCMKIKFETYNKHLTTFRL